MLPARDPFSPLARPGNVAGATIGDVALLLATERIDYTEAWDLQRRIAAARADDGIDDVVWLLEHPPVYTYGRHGSRSDLFVDDATLERLGASCVHSDRGGLMTWHGPGQITGYVIADIRRLGGVRRFVGALVDSMCEASGLASAESDHERMGVYVEGRKVGSVGIRVTSGISTHGVALNRDVDPMWGQIMSACGAPDVTPTSIAAEGGDGARAVVEGAFARALADRFDWALDPIDMAGLEARLAG